MGQVTDINKVYLLVQNKSSYKNILPAEMLAGVIDVNDYVLKYRERYPELDNFLGFAEESQDAEMVSDEAD